MPIRHLSPLLKHASPSVTRSGASHTPVRTLTSNSALLYHPLVLMPGKCLLTDVSLPPLCCSAHVCKDVSLLPDQEPRNHLHIEPSSPRWRASFCSPFYCASSKSSSFQMCPTLSSAPPLACVKTTPFSPTRSPPKLLLLYRTTVM